MNPARTSETPTSAIGGKFVPKAINLTIVHPKHGNMVVSFEESEGDHLAVNHWHSKAVSMWVFDNATTRQMIRSICMNCEVLKIESNWKPWEKLAKESKK